MPNDFDLFDLVELSFDPPEKKADKVLKKIEKKIDDMRSSLTRQSDTIEKSKTQAKLDFLNDIIPKIISADGKSFVGTLFNDLAEKKNKKVLDEFQEFIKFQVSNKKEEVTNREVKKYRESYGLSEDKIKKILKNAGIKIVQMESLDSYPKFPTNAKAISSDLEVFRNTRNPNPNGADTLNAYDLYGFASFLKDNVSGASVYRSMRREELYSIFEEASRRFSQRNDDFGKLCGRIATAGKTYVFNSDENVKAYNNYLLFCSNELTDLFEKLKHMTVKNKLLDDTAQPSINLISKFFPDQKQAVAIYNKESGLYDNGEMYVPSGSTFSIKCEYCDGTSVFISYKAAVAENKCKHCHKPLFKKCQKCAQSVPVGKDKCPNCGFVFASKDIFAHYYRQAEEDYEKGDFASAAKHLFEAENVSPDEKVRIETLRNEIKQAEVKLKEPIRILEGLFAKKNYQTANSKLSEIINAFPSFNTDEYKRIINENLKKAEMILASANALSSSSKADKCMEALEICSDYASAIAFLRTVQPIACSVIRVDPDTEIGVINVSWNPSSERGVTYRLVRNSGDTTPISENAGEILLDNTTVTSFVDKNVKSAQKYCYSVFVSRIGVFSKPVSKTTMLLANVKNCNISQSGKGIRVTWDAPVNCIGATVSRTSGGKTVVLSQSAQGSYEDTNVNYGISYSYCISANYSGGNSSPGVRQVFTLFPTIDSFTISSKKESETTYRISWKIHVKGISLRVKNGETILAEAKSEDESVLVTLPQESNCSISVWAFSGGKWIKSNNSVEANTYTSYPIDKKNTKYEESMYSSSTGIAYNVKFKIAVAGNFSPNTVGFYYVVRSSETGESNWASNEEINKAGDIIRISISEYRRNGYLLYSESVKQAVSFCISVFTIYSVNNEEIVSKPQKLKLNRPLNANLFWEVKHGFLEGNRLCISINGNKPIEYVPKLYLCIGVNNEFINSFDDKNSRIIMTLPSVDLDVPQEEYNASFSITEKGLKKYNFYLFSDEVSNGDVICIRKK